MSADFFAFLLVKREAFKHELVVSSGNIACSNKLVGWLLNIFNRWPVQQRNKKNVAQKRFNSK